MPDAHPAVMEWLTTPAIVDYTMNDPYSWTPVPMLGKTAKLTRKAATEQPTDDADDIALINAVLTDNDVMTERMTVAATMCMWNAAVAVHGGVYEDMVSDLTDATDANMKEKQTLRRRVTFAKILALTYPESKFYNKLSIMMEWVAGKANRRQYTHADLIETVKGILSKASRVGVSAGVGWYVQNQVASQFPQAFQRGMEWLDSKGIVLSTPDRVDLMLSLIHI